MPKTCFVIMPFSSTATCTEQEWTEVFEAIIKPAVNQARFGFECIRSTVSTGAIVNNIMRNLKTADVVIADLTDRNPNVFYELGVRHALKTGTILIAQKLSDVPSDLSAYGVLIYDRTPTGVASFKKEIRRILQKIQSDPEHPDSPVADFLKDSSTKVISQDEINTMVRKEISKVEELVKLTYAQTLDKISEISSLRPSREEFSETQKSTINLDGTFQGDTGLLEISCERERILGRYQFDTPDYVGAFEGTLEDNVIKFTFRWDNGQHVGSGIFLVSDDGNSLDGYYVENLDIDDLNQEQVERSGAPWSFNRV